MHRLKGLWIRALRRFRSERFFQIKPPFKGPGWYFDVRQGEPWGPYSTLEEARGVAARFADQKRLSGEADGRDDELLGADLA